MVREEQEPYAQRIQVMAQSRNIDTIEQGEYGSANAILINLKPDKPLQRNSIDNGQLDQDLIVISWQRESSNPVMIMDREFAITQNGLQIIIPVDRAINGVTWHVGIWQSLNPDRVDEPLRPPPPPPIG